MQKLIMIKYGELTTKKDNRNFFINTLTKNINNILSDIKYEIVKDYYRMFIYTLEIDKVVEKLKKVFGIYEYVIAYEIKDTTLENIQKTSLELLSKCSFKTFKIITNRSDKNYPIKSNDVSKSVGSFILNNIKNITVDVHKPEVILNIEIRNKNTYFYFDNIKALGGYPVGCQSKALLMLSGGIDSVVAGYLSNKRGINLDFIYFESIPHTSIEARNKVISLATKLKEYGNNGKLYVINFTDIQEYIYKNMKSDYLITFMRRMMYRIAEKISKNNKCLAIINGESIGQVASQTLTSILAVNEVTNFPIIRPLATYDKSEIIDIAKKIGTYEISILPYEDCCTVFVPKHPVINPILDIIRNEEKKFNFDLIEEAIKNVKIIKLEETKSEYL